jgi:ribosomal protein S18 acetylase RimI-like enzyme
VTIRTAHLGDEDGIAEVHLNSWHTTYTGLIPQEFLDVISVDNRRSFWKQRIEQMAQGDGGRAILVAENDEGRIVGFVDGGKERDGHPDFDSELYAIYLERQAQGKGLGSNLTSELAKRLRAHGFKRMLVWVLDNNPSRRFYEKIGGSLLADSKLVEFSGKQCVEVAYGFYVSDLGGTCS